MNLRRFILVSLLSVCLGCYSVSSVFASTATKSNAESKVSSLVDYDGFDFNDLYRPLSSNGFKGSGLLGAGNGITVVSNTVDRSLMYARCVKESGSIVNGSTKLLEAGGRYSFLHESTDISRFDIFMPKAAMPVEGSYLFSYSYTSDIGHSIKSVSVFARKNTANAQGRDVLIANLSPDHITTAGEFSRSPVLIDLRDTTSIYFMIELDDKTNAVGGNISIRFVVSEESGGQELGFVQSAEDSAAQTAQNTSQIAQNTSALASAQNETNSKLDQIVQHISDQLFALWNQIAGYLITPWMKQDRDLHKETIDTIEDLDTNVTTTIEQKTEWHANFIIEGLKNLFIPSEEYFKAKISEMQTFFDEKLGFLGYTLTYFIRLLNGIMNASQNTIIRFPGIHAPNRATGEDYVLLAAQDVDLGAQISQVSDGDFNLLEFCRTAGDIVLVLSFLVLLQDKLREVEQ